MNSFNNLTVKTKLLVLAGVAVLGFVAFGWLARNTLQELRVNGPKYQRIVQGKDLIADVVSAPENIIESYLTTLQLVNESDVLRREQLMDRLLVHLAA